MCPKSGAAGFGGPGLDAVCKSCVLRGPGKSQNRALWNETVIVTPSCLPEKKTSRSAFWDMLGHNKSIWCSFQIWKIMVVFASRIWRSLQIGADLTWCNQPTNAALKDIASVYSAVEFIPVLIFLTCHVSFHVTHHAAKQLSNWRLITLKWM